MKYLQLVMGSAGVGKSTYCRAAQDAGRAGGRRVRVVSLDPAAESFGYEAAADVRELVSVDDVMSELGLGPNGALLWALEHVLEERSWLESVLDDALEDDTLLLDCPGCVELYSHVPLLPRLAAAATARGFSVAAVYLVDAHFGTDAAKLIAGSLAALAAMAHFELPHVNVLSKCDLIDKDVLERYLQPAGNALVGELNRSMGARFHRLNEALARIVSGRAGERGSAAAVLSLSSRRKEKIDACAPPPLLPSLTSTTWWASCRST